MTQVQTDMEEMTADAASESNVPRDVNEEFVARVEALLFVADKPLADARIVDLLEIEFADEAGLSACKACRKFAKEKGMTPAPLLKQMQGKG